MVGCRPTLRESFSAPVSGIRTRKKNKELFISQRVGDCTSMRMT